MNLLITGDPKYNDWKEFKTHLERVVPEIQFNTILDKSPFTIISNLKMAQAWARKNKIPCRPFNEEWDKIGHVLVFNSGLKKIEERIEKAKSFGYIVDNIAIEIK